MCRRGTGCGWLRLPTLDSSEWPLDIGILVEGVEKLPARGAGCAVVTARKPAPRPTGVAGEILSCVLF